jgi:hypothetical protein
MIATTVVTYLSLRGGRRSAAVVIYVSRVPVAAVDLSLQLLFTTFLVCEIICPCLIFCLLLFLVYDVLIPRSGCLFWVFDFGVVFTWMCGARIDF